MASPKWSPHQDVPLQHQLYTTIRSEIVDGLWIDRDDFPGELALAERFGVSSITARIVLQKLACEGFLKRRRGRRPEVLFRPDRRPNAITEPMLTDLANNPFSYRLLKIGIEVAPWEACEALGLPGGSELWQCLRLRLVGDRPHSVTMSVQPVNIGERHDLAQFPATPMPLMLARAGFPIQKVHRRLRVNHPPASISVPLGITAHEAVLLATLVQFTAKDLPVEWTRLYLHPGWSTAVEESETQGRSWIQQGQGILIGT